MGLPVWMRRIARIERGAISRRASFTINDVRRNDSGDPVIIVTCGINGDVETIECLIGTTLKVDLTASIALVTLED